jgi:O-antigen/teichoic acid export membrane protein
MVLLAGLGVWGVIGSYMMAVVTALILSLFLIFYVFNLHLRPTLDQSIIKKLHKFAFGNYVSGLIGSVPGMIVPIFITNHLSPEQTAYFYMPNMIGSMLLVVPSSIAKSYFTESSSKNTTLSIRRPMYAVYSILFPIVVLIAIIGKNILNIFGTKYSIEGYNFLLCVSISTLISVVSYFYSYRLLIKNQLNKVIKIQLVTGVVYLSLVFILSSKGILGVGVSIIISKIVELVMLYKSDVSKA